MFHKRFELKENPPWTGDPILQKHSFCNAYRELDRVTLFVINHIARNQDALNHPESLIFSSILFRLFNKPETYLHISAAQNGIDHIHGDFWYEYIPLISPMNWNGELVKDYLENNVLNDGSGEPYSFIRKAYTISSHHKGVPTHIDIIDSILTPLANDMEAQENGMTIDQKLSSMIKTPHTPYEALEALRSLYGIGGGGFLAYEIFCDLNYSDLWNYDAEQTVVNLGPGAIRGLQRLGMESTIDSYKMFLKLQKRVNVYLEKHNFPFYHNRKLSLRSIEHNLCEFDKYRRKIEFDNGISQHRAVLRNFNPSDDKVYMDMLNSSMMKGLYESWKQKDKSGFL